MSDSLTPGDQPIGSNTLALVSLLLGIGGFVPGIGLIAVPFALITGYMALRRAKQYSPQQANRAMAIIGITLGYIDGALYLIVVILFLLPSFGIHEIRIF